ncbi:conserved hypothetical protein [Ricinus communis]|uniref:Uncharacterized protein n=2 Tax=Ricinus communis TaxID=3988 RepID=B9REN5_RICCO|nr:conserved hypothetical protein [Ricinus communis]|eukprot:XP_002512204.1 uncharacterized protein LOC8289329 [Ricinus communis]
MASSYNSSSQFQQPLPIHLCFFLMILLLLLTLSWYTNYEPVLESMFDQVKLVLMVSPLLLLMAVRWLPNDRNGGIAYFIPLPEQGSLHKAGGTPWGVGFLLVFLFFMISYQSSFQERWFPLLSR